MDPSFDPSNTLAVDLYVSICGTHLSLAAYQKGSMNMLAFEHHPDVQDITVVLAGSELAGNSYKSVTILHDHPVVSLIPKEFYDAESTPRFLKFEHASQQDIDAKVGVDDVLKIKAVNVYRSESENIDPTLEHFRGASLIHLHSIWLNRAMAELIETGTHNRILIESDYFLLTVVKDGNLMLFNRFHYESDEDVLYYLIYALEQLGIEAVNSKLTVFGFIQKSERLFTLFTQYFNDVKAGRRPDAITFPESFDRLPAHHHYPLFSCPLCV